jgi:hypothetical protein
MIVDTSHHERTSMAISHFADFVHPEPPRPQYSCVKRTIGIVIGDRTGKGKPEKSGIVRARMPAVNA